MAVYKIMMYENKRRMVVLSPIHLSCRDLEELFAVSPPPQGTKNTGEDTLQVWFIPFLPHGLVWGACLYLPLLYPNH